MTPSSDPQIFAKLCELLQPYNEKGVELAPDTQISGDLNIDSVSVMDFVMEVEDHFDMDIPLNVLAETHSIEDLVRVVAKRAHAA
jgi:acyl carrier protein